jgi:cell division GTPase FtsZ
MNDGLNEIAAVILVMVAFVVGAGAGGCTATRHMRAEAVKRMAARWDVDVNGDTKFEWTLEPILESNNE